MANIVKKQQKVVKAFTPDEKTLLENMSAILNQLLSLETADSGAPAPEGAPPEAAQMAETPKNPNDPNAPINPDEEDKRLNKSEEEDANQDAETRMDVGTEVNDKALPLIGKMLQLLADKNSAQKSSPASMITKAITDALKPLVQKIGELEQFNANMLDAMGVTQEVEKSMDEARTQGVQKSRALPVQSPDTTAIVSELINVIKDMAGNKSAEPSRRFDSVGDDAGLEGVRKDLTTALPFIFRDAIARRRQTLRQ